MTTDWSSGRLGGLTLSSNEGCYQRGSICFEKAHPGKLPRSRLLVSRSEVAATARDDALEMSDHFTREVLYMYAKKTQVEKCSMMIACLPPAHSHAGGLR